MNRDTKLVLTEWLVLSAQGGGESGAAQFVATAIDNGVTTVYIHN